MSKKRTVFIIVFAVVCVSLVIAQFPKLFAKPKTLEAVAKLNHAEILELNEIYSYNTLIPGETNTVIGVCNFQVIKKVKEYTHKDESYPNVLLIRVVTGEEELENWLENYATFVSYDINGKSYSCFEYKVFHYRDYSDVLFSNSDSLSYQKYFVLSGFANRHSTVDSLAFEA